jgi:hypothetical protein
VGIIVLTLDEEPPVPRQPHPAIAGKMQILGDVLEIVPESDNTTLISVDTQFPLYIELTGRLIN